MHATQQQPGAQSDGPYEKSPRLSDNQKLGRLNLTWLPRLTCPARHDKVIGYYKTSAFTLSFLLFLMGLIYWQYWQRAGGESPAEIASRQKPKRSVFGHSARVGAVPWPATWHTCNTSCATQALDSRQKSHTEHAARGAGDMADPLTRAPVGRLHQNHHWPPLRILS